jgi:hypothetical protein
MNPTGVDPDAAPGQCSVGSTWGPTIKLTTVMFPGRGGATHRICASEAGRNIRNSDAGASIWIAHVRTSRGRVRRSMCREKQGGRRIPRGAVARRDDEVQPALRRVSQRRSSSGCERWDAKWFPQQRQVELRGPLLVPTAQRNPPRLASSTVTTWLPAENCFGSEDIAMRCCCPTFLVSGRPLWAGPLDEVVGRLLSGRRRHRSPKAPAQA